MGPPGQGPACSRQRPLPGGLCQQAGSGGAGCACGWCSSGSGPAQQAWQGSQARLQLLSAWQTLMSESWPCGPSAHLGIVHMVQPLLGPPMVQLSAEGACGTLRGISCLAGVVASPREPLLPGARTCSRCRQGWRPLWPVLWAPLCPRTSLSWRLGSTPWVSGGTLSVQMHARCSGHQPSPGGGGQLS